MLDEWIEQRVQERSQFVTHGYSLKGGGKAILSVFLQDPKHNVGHPAHIFTKQVPKAIKEPECFSYWGHDKCVFSGKVFYVRCSDVNVERWAVHIEEGVRRRQFHLKTGQHWKKEQLFVCLEVSLASCSILRCYHWDLPYSLTSNSAEKLSCGLLWNFATIFHTPKLLTEEAQSGWGWQIDRAMQNNQGYKGPGGIRQYILCLSFLYSRWCYHVKSAHLTTSPSV